MESKHANSRSASIKAHGVKKVKLIKQLEGPGGFGISLLKQLDGRFVVRNIDRNLIHPDLGINVGDLMIKINQRPAGFFSQYQMNEILKNLHVGSELIVSVKSQQPKISIN